MTINQNEIPKDWSVLAADFINRVIFLFLRIKYNIL